MILLRGQGGRSAEAEASERLGEILKGLERSGAGMSRAMAGKVREHFKRRWPGSRHYSPDKVYEAGFRDGRNPTADVGIDAAGISRAYWDLTLTPKFRSFLAVPFSGVRGKPADYREAFVVAKRDGRRFLAKNESGRMRFLFTLLKKVFQRKDESMMPTDEELAQAAGDAAAKAAGAEA